MANIPINTSYNGQEYADVIDVLEIGHGVRIYDFTELTKDKDSTPAIIYNDIKVLARCWGFELACGITPIEYTKWTIGPRSMKPLTIKVDEKFMEKARRIIPHILTGMAKEVWYPSVSEQCNSCPHLEYCSL